jgi:hypothetical protein
MQVDNLLQKKLNQLSYTQFAKKQLSIKNN